VREIGITLGAGGGFKSARVAAREALDFSAVSTNHVVMVVTRGGEGVEAASAFKGVALHDAGVVQRLEVAVHGDEVERAIAGLVVNLLGAQWSGCFGQYLEHGQARGGDAEGLFLHAEDGGLNSRGWALSAAVFLMVMSLWHGVKVDITL
jgi:hypothetical protein